MKRGERKPKLIFEGVGMTVPVSDLVAWLVERGVPAEAGMEIEDLLDFAKWEEQGVEFRLHFQQGQIWQADVRTPVIDGVLHGTKIPTRW